MVLIQKKITKNEIAGTVEQMYRRAVGYFNLLPSEFWQMTFWEVQIYLEEKEKKEIDDLNKMIYQAWIKEAFARTKTLKPLKRYLVREQKKVTKEEKEAILTELFEKFGEDVRKLG